jgi:hypothetical protein
VNLVTSKPILNDNLPSNTDYSVDTSVIDNAQKQNILQSINRLDGFFTQNQGQVGNNSVRYYIQGKGVWFLDDGIVFEIKEQLKENEARRNPFDRLDPELEPEIPKPRKSVVLKLNFEGCNKVEPKGVSKLSHRSNYFYGNDSSEWCTNVPNYQEVIYENIYDKIDLRYYSSEKGLKYDFIVKPGGDPNDIILNYEGADELKVDENDNLIVQTSLGNIVDSELFVYQNSDNDKNKIGSEFKLIGSKTFRFEIFNEYNKNKDLVIDPLLYSTYVGGSGGDDSYDLRIDSNGNAYVIGATSSPNFPTTVGANDTTHNSNDDVFVFKLNNLGSSLIYSTYIGGNSGDEGFGIILDSSGNIFGTGYTWSSNFPVTQSSYDTTYNGQDDIFVFKLDSTGSNLLYCTFIGTTLIDYGYDIGVDSNGNAIVSGVTWSSSFPTTAGAYDTVFSGSTDCIVFKLDSTGSSLLFSTFIGGSGSDNGRAIVIDSTGNAYITGTTGSGNFPTTSGAFSESHSGGTYDSYILKLDSSGSSVLYSSFVGGSGGDVGLSITIDTNGNAYITGNTFSTDFPITSGAYDTTHNGYHDVFVVKINSAGSSLNYSTFVGGSGVGTYYVDYGYNIEIDSLGNAYVTGYTGSDDFPTTPGAYDTTFNGVGCVFVFKLNSIGTILLYSTFIGRGNDNFEAGGIDVDNNGIAYVTGKTNRPDFPTTSGSYDTSFNGGWDVFVLKLNFTPNFPPTITDLKISKPSTTRTNSIIISSNSTDIEDPEYQLTPHFYYFDLKYSYWYNTYFSNYQYQNSRWEATFTPPKNATLGLYDFRVRFNDTWEKFSDWFYLNDSLSVLNNIPIIENISISNNSGILGDKTNLWINASDIEESEENLTISIEYRDPFETSWNKTHLSSPSFKNGRWECVFNIPYNASFGYYDFRVQCNDTDGNFSSWFYLNDSFEIFNTAPNIKDMNLSANSIYRTESVFLYINGTDYETPEEMLSCCIQYKPQIEIDWIDLTGNYLNNRWEVSFLTNINSSLGNYDFRVKFDDNETATTGWIYLNGSLEVLNCFPYVQDITLSKMNVYRTDSIIISVNCTDVEDNEDVLDCEIQVKSLSKGWTALDNVIYNLDHWESVFTPNEDAELGSYEVRINFTDQDGGYSGWTLSSWIFNVLNNPPSISEDLDDIEVGIQPLILDLTPYENDIEDSNTELTWGISPQTYTYVESVEIIEIINDTLKITPKENVAGSEDIELTLNDKDTGSAVKSDITIIVDSTISEFTPKVTLLSPVNKAVIGTLTPTLKWELDYTGTETITYLIALDENPDPQTAIKTGFTATEYTLENELIDGKTYYWKVEPTNGICLSGAFSFTINLGFEPIFKVNLTSERDSITIKQGTSKDINLTVTNEGNSVDNFKLEFNSANLQSHIGIDKTNVALDPEINSKVKISIDIPDDFATGDYKITVTATSLTELTANDEATIDVKVVSKDFVPNYDVSISISPPSLELKQGDSDSVNIFVTNEGNIEYYVTIRFESNDFTSDDITIQGSKLKLLKDGDSSARITITVPENMEPGVYTIKFIAENDETSDESSLTVLITEKEDGKKEEDDYTMMYALIGIIVVIIVVLILLFIFLKKKKVKEVEPPIEETQPPPPEGLIPEVPPEQIPTPEIPPTEQPPTQQFQPEQVPVPLTPPPEQPQVSPEQQPTPDVTPQIPQPHGQTPVPKVKDLTIEEEN